MFIVNAIWFRQLNFWINFSANIQLSIGMKSDSNLNMQQNKSLSRSSLYKLNSIVMTTNIKITFVNRFSTIKLFYMIMRIHLLLYALLCFPRNMTTRQKTKYFLWKIRNFCFPILTMENYAFQCLCGKFLMQEMYEHFFCKVTMWPMCNAVSQHCRHRKMLIRRRFNWIVSQNMVAVCLFFGCCGNVLKALWWLCLVILIFFL